LSAIALRQATLVTEGVAAAIVPDSIDPSNPVAALQALDRVAEANILNAHSQIKAARVQAARMATSDPELARLNTLIDGSAPEFSGPQPNIIEGEAIEVTAEPAEPPPPIERA